MGLFLKRSAPERDERRYSSPAVVRWLDAFTAHGASMSSPTIEEALRASAVWACVRVLAGSMSAMPFDAVRTVGKTRQPVTPKPQILTKPSGLVERDVWVHQVGWSMFTDGNAFGLVVAVDAAGLPVQVETLAPAGVTDRKVVDGVPQARVDGTVRRLFPFGDLWHVPGVMVPAGSVFGLSPVAFGGTGISSTLMAEKFGGDYFAGGGHPSSILYSEAQALTDDEAKLAKQAFLKATEGRAPAVLGAGWKHEQIQTNPSDSQFLELLRFEVENQCRFFGVPPSMVYGAVSGQSVTYTNVSQADLHYLKHSLEVPVSRLESALSACLPESIVARANRDAILRADAVTRWQVYKTRLQTKTATVNQIKALEDEPPFDDATYDEPGVPGGMPADPAPAPSGGDQ